MQLVVLKTAIFACRYVDPSRYSLPPWSTTFLTEALLWSSNHRIFSYNSLVASPVFLENNITSLEASSTIIKKYLDMTNNKTLTSIPSVWRTAPGRVFTWGPPLIAIFVVLPQMHWERSSGMGRFVMPMSRTAPFPAFYLIVRRSAWARIACHSLNISSAFCVTARSSYPPGFSSRANYPPVPLPKPCVVFFFCKPWPVFVKNTWLPLFHGTETDTKLRAGLSTNSTRLCFTPPSH